MQSERAKYPTHKGFSLPDRLVGYHLVYGGAKRPIFRQEDGWQYLLDDDGKKEYRRWLTPGSQPPSFPCNV